jgi:hypothetical protein
MLYAQVLSVPSRLGWAASYAIRTTIHGTNLFGYFLELPAPNDIIFKLFTNVYEF